MTASKMFCRCPNQYGASPNTNVCPICTGQPGSFVPVEETIASFKALTEGEFDHLPEQAFFMCGGIEDVERNAAKLKG